MDVLERFWLNVARTTDDTACWLWTGKTRTPQGYGRFRDGVSYKQHVVHRWLLGHIRGEHLTWPAEIACHTCDNKLCVNPSHLYVGSHKDNARDAIQRTFHVSQERKNRTHCKHGHEFTEENTKMEEKLGYVYRSCRTCQRISYKKFRDKRKLERVQEGTQ